MRRTKIKIGEYWVEPSLNTLERHGTRTVVQPRAMDLLVYLAEHAGEVLSTNDLIASVWGGRIVGDHAVYRLIKQLRAALDDDALRPRYIATVKKRGYRLIAPVELHADHAAETGEAHRESARGNRHRTVLLGCALTLLAAVAWWIMADRPGTLEPASGIPVLVANIGGAPEDRDLADRFFEALDLEFEESRRFEVAGRDRIDETLALMRAPDAILTPGTAREVAARDEGPMLVLEGSIYRAGKMTGIRAQLIEPHGLTVLAEAEVETADTGEKVRLIGTTARRVRELADTDAAKLTGLPEPLERVTTKSLQALRLYSQAIALGVSSDAIDLTRSALAVDPEFTSAGILHALLLYCFRHAEQDYLPLAERTLANAQLLSEEESLFVHGSVEMMKGNLAMAADYFESLVAIDSRNNWALRNLVNIFQKTGNRSLEAKHLATISDLWPEGAALAADASRAMAVSGNVERAAFYRERAESLSASEGVTSSERMIVAARLAQQAMTGAGKLWAEGDFAGLLTELRDIETTAREAPAYEQSALSTQLAEAYLGLGRTRQAEDILNRYRHSEELLYAPLISVVTGQAWASSPFEASASSANLSKLVALAHGGELDDIDGQLDLLHEYQRRREQEAENEQGFIRGLARGSLYQLRFTEAQLLKSLGDEARAADLIAQTLDDSTVQARPSFLGLVSALSLAEMREAAGDIDGAIEVLERWGGSLSRTDVFASFASSNVIFWQRNRLKLSELLEDRDPARSAELRSELEAMLAFGDEEHYLVRALHAP